HRVQPRGVRAPDLRRAAGRSAAVPPPPGGRAVLAHPRPGGEVLGRAGRPARAVLPRFVGPIVRRRAAGSRWPRLEASMIIDLPNTTVSKIARSLVSVREEGGAVALGRVLTLVIVASSGL